MRLVRFDDGHPVGAVRVPVVRVGVVSAVNDLRAEALFCSPLQPSERPSREAIDQAITAALLAHTTEGCAGQVAQEFGDHPEAAAARMRWARRAVADAFALAVVS